MAKGGGVSGRPFVEAGLLPILAAVLQDHSVRGRADRAVTTCGGLVGAEGAGDARQISCVFIA